MKKVAMVLMAAGNSERFKEESGENKLFADFGGRKVYEAALSNGEAAFAKKVVVSQYEEIEKAAGEKGFMAIHNGEPEKGISRTIRLGTEYVRINTDCEGAMYFVADQPLLRRETVDRLLEVFNVYNDCIVVPKTDENLGNPCIFDRKFFEELEAIEGDKGGKQVIKKHPDKVVYVEVPREELMDIDNVKEYEEAMRFLHE